MDHSDIQDMKPMMNSVMKGGKESHSEFNEECSKLSDVQSGCVEPVKSLEKKVEEKGPKLKSVPILLQRNKHKYISTYNKGRDPLKIYTCEACPATFSRITQLKYHARLHFDNQKALECEGCHIVFSSHKKLSKHKQKQHFQNLVCELCNSEFSQTSSFRLHMRLHSGERPYSCNECGATFVQSSHLNIHKRTHTGEKPYQCDLCKQSFKQISHLRTHERIHTQTKPFRCGLCGNSFIQKSSLNRHMRIHTGERPYMCTLCQATFCVKNNLNRHMAIHTGNQPFSCESCGATFGQSVDLKRHIISHTGVKPFRCEQCQAAFSRNSNLKWHKLTHTGETPFKCDQCSCQFMKPRDLKKHKITHGPPKVHPCSVCQLEFPQLSLLKKHMLTNHSDHKPFCCTYCKATFSAKHILKRHLQRHISLKPEESNSQSEELKDSECQDSEGISDDDELNKTVKTTEPSLNQVNGVSLAQNTLIESNTTVPQQYMAYQLQVQDSNLHSTVQSSVYSDQDNPQQTLTYATSTIGLPSLQPLVQSPMPTLMLSAGPGQPVRAARPANNCQNHHAHVITMTTNNQVQSWCFCDVPAIPSNTVNSEITVATGIGNHHQLVQQEHLQHQQESQPHNQLEKMEQVTTTDSAVSEEQTLLGCQQVLVRPVSETQNVGDGKISSTPVQFHLYADGQLPPQAQTQPVWINGSWLTQK